MKLHDITPSVWGLTMTKYLLCIGLFTTALLMPRVVHAADSTAAELWFDKCARCHGDTGAGDTPLGRMLKVANYGSKKAQEALTDEHLFKLILEGRTTNQKKVMPAFKEEITEGEAKSLVRYIRSLEKSL